MNVSRRLDHSPRLFVKRTIAAQLHALGCVLMVAGAFVLIPLAQRMGPDHLWACAAFLFSGFFLFFVSSTYHFLTDGYEGSHQLHLFFENLDHFSIYLFIAGTYTPFLLSAVAAPWRTPLIVGIWGIALLGILYTWFKPHLPPLLRSRAVYTSLFVIMGWLLLIRIGEIYAALSPPKLALLLAAGIAYSTGALVYATKRPKLAEGVFGFHELWHLLVLVGAALHYGLILSFYLKPV